MRNLAQTTRSPTRIEPRAAAREPRFLGSVSWRPPRDIDFEEWARHGHRLGAAGRGASWWIGDWLNYGEATYGEHYARAAEITGYEVQSLMNMAYVASHFEISRRRERVSWSHHAELASRSDVRTGGMARPRGGTPHLGQGPAPRAAAGAGHAGA